MANQPHHSQQPGEPRKELGSQPPKEAPRKPRPAGAGSEPPSPQPQDPADLGHDPKPADVQAGNMGQSSEKTQH
ncbi:MAG TPA: hypothetical protein VHE77_07320 [Dongiaceae bacterium]|jgi:hypothetical protein|nr:hypothetical protein [Dongiaceae bacterium]